MTSEDSEPAGGEEDERGEDQLASTSRRLRNSLISLAVFFGIVAGLLVGIPVLLCLIQGMRVLGKTAPSETDVTAMVDCALTVLR